MRNSYVMLLVSAIAAGAAAQTQKLVVPALFPHTQITDTSRGGGSSPGNYDWNRIKAQGNAVQIISALGDTGGFQQVPNPSSQLDAIRSQLNANRTQCASSPCPMILGY